MMRSQIASILSFAALVAAWGNQHCSPPDCNTGWETRFVSTDVQDVEAAAAAADTFSPTSNVPGMAFDRFVIIYFENQDYDKAIGDPNFKFFAEKGITLSNYYAVTHPSQPNYMASIAGDYFGMQNDHFLRSPRNISTVIDLLEYRGISWAHYEEDMPYSGFEGIAFKNQHNGRNDYVRKHNPAVMHDSVAYSERRLSQIKNLSMIDTERSMFHKDLSDDKLPQWMFITPNMTSDGHDSSVTVAGAWCRSFLEPLLDDKRFMKNTLVLITFDENETYAEKNNIMAVLVGDSIAKELVNSTDRSFYNHYSEIATVSANWKLPTLGRWDVGANIFQAVAYKTGDTVREWSSDEAFQMMHYNTSYAGYFSTDGGNKKIPPPNLRLDKNTFNKRKIHPRIKEKYINTTTAKSREYTYYSDTIEVPDGMHPPEFYTPKPRVDHTG